MHRTDQSQGYTLIELLLYVSLVGILLVSLTAFLGMSIDARVKTQSINEVDQQGAAAMDYIQQTIRNATAITQPVASTAGATLALTVPTASLSPTVFSLNGTTLQVKEGAAAAVPLTNSKVRITNLTFTNVSRGGTDGAVRVSLTIERINTSGRNIYDSSETFTTTVSVR